MRYIFFLILLNSTYMYSQKEYARTVISKLASPEFHGRGYVNQGDLMAASYIKTEALKNKLVKPLFQDSVFQYFNIDVNTFPSNVSIKIGDKFLIPGSDFIIAPNSGLAQGIYKIVRVKNYNFVDELKQIDLSDGVVLLLDFAQPLNRDSLKIYHDIISKLSNIAPVIKLNEGKLTWSVSSSFQRRPVIEMSSKHIRSKDTIIELNIVNRFQKDYKTQNIGFIIEGTKSSKEDDIIVFTAHYDHLGEMGKGIYFPGANDNASGVSMVLSLMKYYNNNPSKNSIVFVFFGAEEVGLLGSRYFVEHSPINLKDIKCLINLDIFGTGDDGVTVVNATEFPQLFQKLEKANKNQQYLTQIKKRGKAANSDHYWFSELGIPAFFIYTMGGVSYYHDILDKEETLPLTKFDDIQNLLIKFTKKIK